MNPNQDPFYLFAGISIEEAAFLQKASEDLTEKQQKTFMVFMPLKEKIHRIYYCWPC